jgi:hypothetical protein
MLREPYPKVRSERSESSQQQFLAATSRSVSRDLPDYVATALADASILDTGASSSRRPSSDGWRSGGGGERLDFTSNGRLDQGLGGGKGVLEPAGSKEEPAGKRDSLSVDEAGRGGRRLSTGSAYNAGQEEGQEGTSSRREALDLSSNRMGGSTMFLNNEEQLTSCQGLSSPLRARDTTIEPPELFSSKKKDEGLTREVSRGQVVEGRKYLKASKDLRSNSWDNKENTNSKSYESQTLQRKSKSSSSHSRSKRMRNRSLEMVLDEPATDGSSATKRYPTPYRYLYVQRQDNCAAVN